MEESFPHLSLNREEPVTEKRPGGRPYFVPPADPSAHGRRLQVRLESAKNQTDKDIGGFDDRRLFRFTVKKGFDPDTLRNVSPEIEFVSQEGDEIVVAFVSTAALESFEATLTSLHRSLRQLEVQGMVETKTDSHNKSFVRLSGKDSV